MSRKNTDYADQIRLCDDAAIRVDVHAEDSAALRSFLRAFDLYFQYEKRETGGQQLTFDKGTTVSQVHAALAEFDTLSRKWQH